MVSVPPWYGWVRRKIAPTEKATNVVLIILILASVLILWKGDAVVKGLWVVYWISP